jgi:hypothetical protein
MAAVTERPLGRGGRVALAGLLVAGSVLALADVLTLLFFVSYAAVGALLVVRRPTNAIGWLMLVLPFGIVGTTVPADVDVVALQAGTASTRDFLIAWFAGWSGLASYVALVALSIVFPSGRLPAGRWRWAATTLLAVGVVLIVLTAIAPTVGYVADATSTVVVPNRFAVLPSLPTWSLLPPDAAILGVVALVVIGIGASLVRYRRTRGIVRLQMRWLVTAILSVVAAVLFGFASLALFGERSGGLGWIPAILAFPSVPLAIGIAVTRYRLFEIDRIISRTISYALVSGGLVGVFVVAVLALQAALGGITLGETIPVAASTLVVAALAQPLRRRIQGLVDRRFNRARVDADRTVEAFADRLRDEVNLGTLRGDLSAVTVSAFHPDRVGVWIRPTEAARQ